MHLTAALTASTNRARRIVRGAPVRGASNDGRVGEPVWCRCHGNEWTARSQQPRTVQHGIIKYADDISLVNALALRPDCHRRHATTGRTQAVAAESAIIATARNVVPSRSERRAAKRRSDMGHRRRASGGQPAAPWLQPDLIAPSRCTRSSHEGVIRQTNERAAAGHCSRGRSFSIVRSGRGAWLALAGSAAQEALPSRQVRFRKSRCSSAHPVAIRDRGWPCKPAAMVLRHTGGSRWFVSAP
jgi:hypothetical protein